MTPFRRLAAWRRAHALALHVHALTERSGFSRQGALVEQMRRAAIDIPSHIARGSAYSSGTAFAQGLELALAAARELDANARLARDLQIVSATDYTRLDARVDEVCRILVVLRRTVLEDGRVPAAKKKDKGEA